VRIDHVTIAGSELAPLERAFTEVGLAPEYGGVHSHGRTHMALFGFADGSYIELIAPVAGQEPPVWPEHMREDGGPCAWAITADDLDAEAVRLRRLGVPLTGPVYYNRRRTDGVLAEWDAVFLGDPVRPGATLPFLIKDRTPRSWRVTPSASVAALDAAARCLKGIDTVILGVRDLPAVVRQFQEAFGWNAPAAGSDEALDAQLAVFEGTPIAVASPRGGENWLTTRLARFGDGPCAVIIGADTLAAGIQRFPVVRETPFASRRIAWIDPARLCGSRIGLVE